MKDKQGKYILESIMCIIAAIVLLFVLKVK